MDCQNIFIIILSTEHAHPKLPTPWQDYMIPPCCRYWIKSLALAGTFHWFWAEQHVSRWAQRSKLPGTRGTPVFGGAVLKPRCDSLHLPALFSFAVYSFLFLSGSEKQDLFEKRGFRVHSTVCAAHLAAWLPCRPPSQPRLAQHWSAVLSLASLVACSVVKCRSSVRSAEFLLSF